MSGTDLRALEREVEEARGRVLNDIVALRSPAAVAELKRDVTDQITRTKDEWIGSARSAAAEEVNSVVAGAKARALANPLAVLAIGAGIGWKLKNHPPIMSALVGLGLYGLMRADTSREASSVTWTRDTARTIRRTARDWSNSDEAAQLADYAEEAQRQAERYRRQAGELASEAGERAREARTIAEAKAAEWSAEAKEAASRAASYGRDLAHQAEDVAHRAMDRGRHLAEEAGEAGERAYRYGRRRAAEAGAAGERYYRAFNESENRDSVLLGAAGAAIALAIGLAATRRSGR